MSIRKYAPTVTTTAGKRCPVCGEVSYSRYGIHPQCVLAEADAKTIAVRKRKRAR